MINKKKAKYFGYMCKILSERGIDYKAIFNDNMQQIQVGNVLTIEDDEENAMAWKLEFDSCHKRSGRCGYDSIFESYAENFLTILQEAFTLIDNAEWKFEHLSKTQSVKPSQIFGIITGILGSAEIIYNAHLRDDEMLITVGKILSIRIDPSIEKFYVRLTIADHEISISEYYNNIGLKQIKDFLETKLIPLYQKIMYTLQIIDKPPF